eukprot:gene20178-26915_t
MASGITCGSTTLYATGIFEEEANTRKHAGLNVADARADAFVSVETSCKAKGGLGAYMSAVAVTWLWVPFLAPPVPNVQVYARAIAHCALRTTLMMSEQSNSESG